MPLFAEQRERQRAGTEREREGGLSPSIYGSLFLSLFSPASPRPLSPPPTVSPSPSFFTPPPCTYVHHSQGGSSCSSRWSGQKPKMTPVAITTSRTQHLSLKARSSTKPLSWKTPTPRFGNVACRLANDRKHKVANSALVIKIIGDKNRFVSLFKASLREDRFQVLRGLENTITVTKTFVSGR